MLMKMMKVTHNSLHTTLTTPLNTWRTRRRTAASHKVFTSEVPLWQHDGRSYLFKKKKKITRSNIFWSLIFNELQTSGKDADIEAELDEARLHITFESICQIIRAALWVFDLPACFPSSFSKVDDIRGSSASKRISKACLKNVFTVILIFIYLLLTAVAVFLAYQTISEFLDKLNHPVMSVTYKEVDRFSPPGLYKKHTGTRLFNTVSVKYHRWKTLFQYGHQSVCVCVCVWNWGSLQRLWLFKLLQT